MYRNAYHPQGDEWKTAQHNIVSVYINHTKNTFKGYLM